MKLYIKAVNDIMQVAFTGTNIKKYSSKDIKANLPSAVRAQVARDARSVLAKYRKNCHKAVLHNRKHPEKIHTRNAPVLKKPVCFWNNQNFKIQGSTLRFPLMESGKSTMQSVEMMLTKRQEELFKSKLGTLRIVEKRNELYAQITYETNIPEPETGAAMGVDLGLKVPAVTVTDTGKTRFFGNGRKNKYLKRFYRYQRKKLQSKKKMSVVKRIEHKETRVFRDIDHKVSRKIVDFAVDNNVKVIKLERLTNIRSTARTSRKNERNLHTWSFYRLAEYIEYKARLLGIQVVYVNPKDTSKRCPSCGKLNMALDRNYQCSCGFHKHRDIVGAYNICYT